MQEHDTQRYQYDTYDLGATFSAHAFTPVWGVAEAGDLSPSAQGLKTHEEIFETFEKVQFKFGDAPSSCLRTFYYDHRHRPLQHFETTPDGHTLRVSYKYDYSGNVVLREEYYSAPGLTPQTVRSSYTYDSRGRQLREQVSVNGSAMTDIASSYDDLGRVSTTTAAVSDNKDLQTQYCYNIQGWTTRIGSELSESFSLDNPYIVSTFVFSQTLSYFTPKVATPSYSGNIAEQSWMYEGARAEHLYAFTYDALSRLKDATQYRASLLPKPLVLDNSNTERGITYDRNGNLLTLQRTSEGAVSDNLNYHYAGNRLMSLSGSRQATYTYDCMGNMTHDGVHNLDLSYNYLNLVKKVSQSGSTLANYRYLWDGTKVSATNGAGNGLLYQGSLVYNKQGAAPGIQR